MTMPDLLDRVIDNQATRTREVWRDGRIVATCPANFDARLLRHFNATGPFGKYPDAAKEQA